MPFANHLALTSVAQLLPAVLTNRLEQGVPRYPASIVDGHQRLTYEPAHQVEDLGLVDRAAATYWLGRLEAETARKHGKPAKKRALGLGEELITPVHRGTQCPLSWRPRTAPLAQEAKTVA